MKKFAQLLSLALILSLVSCNKDQNNPTDNPESMLKSVTVNKIGTDNFSVTHEVSPNVGSEYYTENGINTIQLIKNSAIGKRINYRNYRTVNHELTVHFISDSDNSLPQFKLLDSDLPPEMELLKDYSFSFNDAGVLTLHFTVKKGVTVQYINNDGKNEIHLSMGQGTQTEFTKTYDTSLGDDINFNFVQNISKDNEREKPIFIIFDGEGNF